MEGALWLLILAAVLLVFIVIYSNKKEKKDKEQEAIRQEWRQKIADSTAKKQAEYDEGYADLVSKYGIPDKVISLRDGEISQQVMLFEGVERLFLCGRDVEMKSILSSELIDESIIVKGKETIKTTTDPWDTLGKMDGASMLLGRKTGNLVGAASAEKTTTVSRQPDRKIDAFSIKVTVDSLTDPVLVIKTDNRVKADELSALLEVIVHRNRGVQ